MTHSLIQTFFTAAINITLKMKERVKEEKLNLQKMII
eukprot:CAMPEP_0170535500 /NCGR_PEP_ID=MMETSP0209-20121228/100991_1 /TAXON_ID=665100 ORGANISM="Litonotus pictus, Strain P1" /NCGR_SAMPLE_ID=MMETSP0209 /ASSEMBLY_ACC=CAM_ASM_000301 /LENGTH=36 /DNA_ID= /DNA_START= /DNA_END= /DNA_ORIENTATION=